MDENYSKVRQVLISIFFLNLLVAAIKIFFGLLAGSLSMVADSFHSFFDSTSNLVGLVAVGIASKPPDKEHPYGHKKYEYLATVAIAALIFLACFEILQSAGSRLLDGDYSSLHIGFATVCAMLVTIAINYFVASYEKKKGVELCSPFLEADSMHTQTDIYVSLSVLASFVFVELGYPILDPLVAVLIAVLIVKMGYSIVQQSSFVLCDASVLDEKKVHTVVLGVAGVNSCHSIRTRGSKEHVYVDLHIMVDPNLPIEAAHEISHNVEDKIKKSFSGVDDVVVHVEPSIHQKKQSGA